MQQGQLGHDDNPGGGSVFWLQLPLSAGAAAPPEEPALAPNEPYPAPGVPPAQERALRVLVVDDIAMNRDIAGCFLRAAGHLISCAESATEAVAAVAKADFDVVLMDVRMPGIDGLEATRRIRCLGGARGRVPIVALTAQAFTEQVAACRLAGMESHLAKPFTPQSLLDAVRGAVTAGEARYGAMPGAAQAALTA